MPERKLVVEIIGDASSLETAFRRSSRGADTWSRSLQRATRGGIVATVGFRGLGRSVAFASGAFLGGAGFVAGARAAIKAASDLGEEVNKTNVLFGRSASGVVAWSRTTANALGLSQRASLQAAGNFGAMFETLELGDDVAARMSRQLVGLGADLASFSNQDPSEMLDRLRSGLAGEAEPLRRFGILLSEARVQQEAYASGITKAGEKLTEQEKVLARFNLILKDSAAAQGDFQRTSTSQANQERINAALREEAARRIGQVLLPAYNQATRAINKWLGEERNLARVQNTTSRALEVATKAAQVFTQVFQALAPIVERLVAGVGGLANAVKLLVAAFVASKIISFTGALTGLNAQMAVGTTRATAFRAALLRLGAIGLITIGVEVILNREAIEQKVSKLLAGTPFRGLVTQPIELPVNIKEADLERTRRLVRALGDDSSIVTKALDKAIEKMRELDRQRLRGARAGVQDLREQLDGLGKKEVRVEFVQHGIEQLEKQVAGIKDRTVKVRVLQEGLANLQRDLANVKDKKVSVQFVQRGLAEILEGVSRIPDQIDSVVRMRVEVETGGVGGIFGAVDKAIANAQATVEQALAKARAARDRSIKQFAGLADRRSLELEQAATKGRQAELEENRRQQAIVREQIRIQGHTVDLDRELFELQQQESQLLKDLAQARKDHAASMRQARVAALQAAADAAGYRVALLESRGQQRLALAALEDDEKAVRAQIAVSGRTLALQQDLERIRKERNEIRARIAQAERDARTRQQFRTLGLTAEGEEPVPGVASLSKRAAALTERLRDSNKLTPKVLATLQNIGKVLAQGANKVGRDVRAAIERMLDDIAAPLKDSSGKRANQFKKVSFDILEGLGLTPEQIRELRARISQIGPGGTVPIGGRSAFGMPVGGGAPIPPTATTGTFVINIHGDVKTGDADDFIQQMQRRAKRSRASRRGVRPGVNRGGS